MDTLVEDLKRIDNRVKRIERTVDSDDRISRIVRAAQLVILQSLGELKHGIYAH